MYNNDKIKMEREIKREMIKYNNKKPSQNHNEHLIQLKDDVEKI